MDQRVLVVDDDPSIRLLLTFGLQSEGYTVRTAGDGAVGLAELEAWRPGLVLLDLMMPGLDGWEFRTRQLARPELVATPVIVLTASDLPRQHTDALQPAAIVPKPFDFGRLLTLVATHF